MIYRNSFIFIALIGLWSAGPFAAEIDQDQPGGWYMLTFNEDFTESRFCFQGDVQYCTWDGSGDLEQRWVNGQDFRSRLRYALFANVPLNRPDLSPGAFYLALYNEIFINGERDIGGGAEVDFYDRNRLHGALGYKFSNTGQIQVGYM